MLDIDTDRCDRCVCVCVGARWAQIITIFLRNTFSFRKRESSVRTQFSISDMSIAFIGPHVRTKW